MMCLPAYLADLVALAFAIISGSEMRAISYLLHINYRDNVLVGWLPMTTAARLASRSFFYAHIYIYSN